MTISAEATEEAAGLVSDYFHAHAAGVFGDAAVPEAERVAAVVARHLRTNRLERFNAKALRRAIGGPVREAGAMDAALGEMEEAGLIRDASERAGGGPGRKARNFLVHPALAGGGDGGR